MDGFPAQMKTGAVASTLRLDNIHGLNQHERIGTRNYVVIAYCPSLSVAYGSGGQNFPTTSKLSGLVTFQTDNIGTAFTADMFNSPTTSHSMSALYGNQGEFVGTSTAIYSGRLDITLLAQRIG